ncbi:GTPase IMAP family member 8 [Labeo rohita]|uniref:GTPase IMAP family member 8 n=1 Tax=Labeo rohita TaxID=84645 RepID=A0ABQ8LAX8_LABRO|nr:GTPase IMAP family member 8 [Labeo rohita]
MKSMVIVVNEQINWVKNVFCLLIVNIMLLGSTEAGKNVSGNTILSRARNLFEDDFSPEAVTKVCQSAQTEVDVFRRISCFNNNKKDRFQVTELLKEIKKKTLRMQNRYRKYTEQDYKETQEVLLHSKCVIGTALGGLISAAGAAIVFTVGAVAPSLGQAALLGATVGAAVLAVAAGVGVHLFETQITYDISDFIKRAGVSQTATNAAVTV